MADNFVSETGLGYFADRLKIIYATKNQVDTLSTKIDDVVSEGGEPNTIETISVNDTRVLPDDNKNVNIDLSAYATTAYVDENGGAIQSVKVNGVTQSITDKAVDISIPTSISTLTNDSGFQTASDVESAINTKVASAYIYKGSVASQDDLPASANIGAVYDVQTTGMNYAWNGTAWDALGQYIDTSTLWAKDDLTAMTTAQIDALFED